MKVREELPFQGPEPPPRFPVRMVVLLLLASLALGGLWTVREYFGPKWAWRRAIHGSNPKARADLWMRLQRQNEIDGLDRAGTIAEVFASLSDPDPVTRGWAVSTVPSIKAEPLDAIPRIAEKLTDSVLQVRVKAATALGEVFQRGGTGREEAIAALTLAIKDKDPAVRRAAAASIGQVVYESGKAVDPLLSDRPDDPALNLVAPRLLDGDLGVRVEAAYVLACNGRGQDAVPKLAALVREQPLQAPLPYLADRAFLVLMALAIHSEEAVAFFIAEMAVDREGYPDRPRDALAWAAKKSPDARARVRHLAGKLLETDKPSIRHNAGLLLHEIGSDQAALPVLIEALKDVAVDIRIRAVEALADIGSLDPRVVPALESAGTDSSREVRDHAAAAIEQIEWAEILSEMDGGMP